MSISQRSSLSAWPRHVCDTVNFGAQEAEFGMSWCAGFNGDFWSGYREVIPEAPKYRQRAKLYEAYHIINHYNLFGGGYLQQGISLLEALLK